MFTFSSCLEGFLVLPEQNAVIYVGLSLATITHLPLFSRYWKELHAVTIGVVNKGQHEVGLEGHGQEPQGQAEEFEGDRGGLRKQHRVRSRRPAPKPGRVLHGHGDPDRGRPEVSLSKLLLTSKFCLISGCMKLPTGN